MAKGDGDGSKFQSGTKPGIQNCAAAARYDFKCGVVELLKVLLRPSFSFDAFGDNALKLCSCIAFEKKNSHDS